MSHELKVVWEPENSYGEIDFEAQGSWTTFYSRDEPVGRLFTDHDDCLSYMNYPGSTLHARAREAIRTCADMKLPAEVAFSVVVSRLLEDDAVRAEQASGLLSGVLEYPVNNDLSS